MPVLDTALREGRDFPPLIRSRTLNSLKMVKWETARKSWMSHWNHNDLGLLYYGLTVRTLKFSVVSTSLSLQANRKWFSPWKTSTERGLRDWLPAMTSYCLSQHQHLTGQNPETMMAQKNPVEVSLWDSWLRTYRILSKSGRMSNNLRNTFLCQLLDNVLFTSRL